MKQKSKYYVVWEGRETGVFSDWDDCKRQIYAFPDAKYMAFDSEAAAVQAFMSPYEKFAGKKIKMSAMDAETKAKYSEPVACSISVDAACSGNPGKMEYRGVRTDTGEQLFYQGVFEDGTNNIGEFLAIVHALAMMKKYDCAQPVYSDSKNAISWVRAKKCRTRQPLTTKNAKLFDLISRAEKWLAENIYQNAVLKWETQAWGEIKADFGRK